MSFTVHEATESDIPAIARVLASDGQNALFELQLGAVDRNVLYGNMGERIARAMKMPDQQWIVARDEDSGDIMSYAQWVLPQPEGVVANEPSPEVRLTASQFPRPSQQRANMSYTQEAAKAEEEYRKTLLPQMNVSLMMEFRAKLRVLRKSALNRNRHYSMCHLLSEPRSLMEYSSWQP